MKKAFFLCLIGLIALAALLVAREAPSADKFLPSVLVRIIPMPGTEGRFDHVEADLKGGRLFAAVYG
jgi:hypothetical protein